MTQILKKKKTLLRSLSSLQYHELAFICAFSKMREAANDAYRGKSAVYVSCLYTDAHIWLESL